MAKKLLSIRNVYKSYIKGKTPVYALDGVSIDIYQGEVLALLGVNGAGKTTLSSIIATLHPPTSGEIFFHETPLYENLEAYRRVMGYCPQTPNLDPYLTVEENLLFAGRYYLLPHDVTEERTKSLMKRFELERYANYSVTALSGGYKQRVSLARALLPGPEILILDEPTVGLDPAVRRDLWETVAELNKTGLTIVLTTHYLEEAEQLAHRACIVHRGKILLTQNIEELKRAHQQTSFEQIFIDLTKQVPESV